jgi:predicted metal-binding protein
MRRSVEKYCQLGLEMGLSHVVSLGPEQVFFDPRARLKCRWGCEDFHQPTIKCGSRGLSHAECVEMINRYSDILLLHGHDAHVLSKAVLALEAAAFHDGHYFAFGVRACKLCPSCAVDQGKECIQPEKVRPCDQAMGIDIYRTARAASLPIRVLQSKNEQQNRYGLVLIN